jgi:hypothetical protein
MAQKWTARISATLFEELLMRAEAMDASDEDGGDESAREAAAAVRRVCDLIKAGKRPQPGADLDAVVEEMRVLESFDVFTGANVRDWYEGAAWLGGGTSSQCMMRTLSTSRGRKPRKIIIDGVTYEFWRAQ